MIKHLKPRSKIQIIFNVVKDLPYIIFSIIKIFFHLARVWNRTSLLLKNKKNWKYTSNLYEWKLNFGKWLVYNKQKDWYSIYTLFEKDIRKVLKNKIWEETYNYTYTTKKGEIQKAKAIVNVSQRVWKQYWFKIHLYDRKQTFIEVKFKPCVGEKNHDAGCYMCDWEMIKGETPLDTLKRMEKIRIF